MQDQELRELRRELGGIERGAGRRYPDELKARIVAWARRELARGATVNATARAIALHPRTLEAWTESAPAQASTTLIPVEVVASPAANVLVAVVSPSGYRLEGLTLEDAVRVLARLR